MRLSLLQRKEAHEDSVWAAAWAPGSNTLVTGSVDESIKLWSEVGDTLEQKHILVSDERGAGRGRWRLATELSQPPAKREGELPPAGGASAFRPVLLSVPTPRSWG